MNFTVIIVIGALMIGLSKGGFGGPVLIAMLTPLLTLALPAGQAVGIVLPLLIFGDIFAVWIYWKKWDIQQLKLLLPSAVVGIALGGVLLLSLVNANQNELLRRILGLFTLLVVLYKVGSSRLKSLQYEPHSWHGYLAGWATGFGSALANIGSPPFTAYMLLQDVSPMSFLGTSSLFFAIVNLLKLPITLLNPHVLDVQQFLGIVWVLPLIPVGIWFGKKFAMWLNPAAFENFMLIILFLMSLLMLFGT
jgi:uncharacterized membrane protein YfcA